MSNRIRPLRRAILLVVALFVVALPAGAQEGQPPLPENPYERLAEVKRRQAEKAMAVDLLSASAQQVQARLAQVESWVAAQEQVVAAAQAELVEANVAAGRARAAEEAKAAEFADLQALMREIAVEAFIRPRQDANLGVLVDRDLNAAIKGDVMLRAKSDHDNAVADALAAAEAELRKLRVVADDEARRAKRLADEASTALGELHEARLEQVGLAERIKVDLETTVVAIQELGGAEAEATLAVQRETEALLARIGRDAAVPLVDVRGFRVHAEIAPALDALLVEAERDGIILRGWGHRSTQQQVALRRQHCGGEGVSDADAVYGLPASACSPPTAKPGSSMHELGLAIDFTHNGASIATRQSPAFQWLAEHAGAYGLHNLPSEPWHWSVNGD
jgi:hypothetical protein